MSARLPLDFAPTIPLATVDGAELRAELIAAGVLRPSRRFLRKIELGGSVVFALDSDGIEAAAQNIIRAGYSRAFLADIIEQADPRVAAKLRELVGHG